MEGLEGFKVLSEYSNNNTPIFILLGIAIITCVIGLITAIINEDFGIVLMFGLFIAVSIVAILGISGKDNAKQYKITPIEAKYSIDLEKYEIYRTDGEVITIIEKKVDK